MVASWQAFPHGAPPIPRPDRPQGPPTSSEASRSWWTSRSWRELRRQRRKMLERPGQNLCEEVLSGFFCATWRSWRRWQTLGEAGNWKITNQWLKVGSLNVPIEHHPTIRYMVYNGYYKVMSNIPKMGQLPTPVESWVKILKLSQLFSAKAVRLDKILCLFPADGPPGPPLPRIESPMTMKIKPPNLRKISLIIPKGLKKLSFF